MYDALRAPPWGNLWRHLVTTYLFWFLLLLIVGLPLGALTGIEVSDWTSGVAFILAAVAYVLAAIVVWSDIPWPGDPE